MIYTDKMKNFSEASYCRVIVTKVLMIVLVLMIAQPSRPQTNTHITELLRWRVEGARVNQSIVVAVIEQSGTQFISFGKINGSSSAPSSNEDTVFEIGSITKAFTGILLSEAVKRGEVELDDVISKYLPNTVKTPRRNGKEITLLDLATHTSALPRLPDNFAPTNNQNPYADYTVEQMYDFLAKHVLTRDIGSHYDYSNLGMGLLGHILSLRAKMSYEDLVKSRILKPLDMNDSSIALSPTLRKRTAQGFDENGEPTPLWDLPTMAGAGALRSTTKDLAKFVGANLGLTKTNLAGVLEAAQRTQRDADRKMKIGLGWHLLGGSGSEIVWHNGGTGGFRSFVGFNRGQKRGIVVLSNSTESIDDIGFNFLDPQMPIKKIRPFVAVGEGVLESYVGRYELVPSVVFTITRKADKLFAQLTGQPQFRVFAETENRFYYKVVDAQLTFNQGKDGKIESLTLHQGGDQVARKIK